MHSPIPVIAIGRQFGSGGREVGQQLARLLGIAYFDKELLAEAARTSGMAADFIEAGDERAPGFLSAPWTTSLGLSGTAYFMGGSPLHDDAVYRCQSDAIRLVASRGPCVIVGRTADHVLRTPAQDTDNTDQQPTYHVLSVFVTTPPEHCARRIVERGDCANIQQALALLQKRNKQRAAYYNFYTDHRWGDAANYDLCVDTSLLGIEATAEILAQVAHRALGL